MKSPYVRPRLRAARPAAVPAETGRQAAPAASPPAAAGQTITRQAAPEAAGRQAAQAVPAQATAARAQAALPPAPEAMKDGKDAGREESTGVLDGLMDDVEQGIDDINGDSEGPSNNADESDNR